MYGNYLVMAALVTVPAQSYFAVDRDAGDRRPDEEARRPELRQLPAQYGWSPYHTGRLHYQSVHERSRGLLPLLIGRRRQLVTLDVDDRDWPEAFPAVVVVPTCPGMYRYRDGLIEREPPPRFPRDYWYGDGIPWRGQYLRMPVDEYLRGLPPVRQRCP